MSQRRIPESTGGVVNRTPKRGREGDWGAWGQTPQFATQAMTRNLSPNWDRYVVSDAWTALEFGETYVAPGTGTATFDVQTGWVDMIGINAYYSPNEIELIGVSTPDGDMKPMSRSFGQSAVAVVDVQQYSPTLQAQVYNGETIDAGIMMYPVIPDVIVDAENNVVHPPKLKGLEAPSDV